MSEARVAAVVVRWRGGDEVERCIASLVAERGLTEIVLVDSGSGDGGGERLAAAFPRAGLLALPENRSFAFAADAGVAATSAPLVLLLNPDTELRVGALEALVGELERRPDAAGAVPLLVGPDGALQHRWQLRRLPGVVRLALGLPGAPAFAAAPPVGTPVEQPAAAAWLVRRPVWEALGGLDPDFSPAWWEDVDFCARLAAGLEDGDLPARSGFVVVPAARIAHGGGSSVVELGDEAFLVAYHRNLARYAARHHPGRVRPLVAVLRLVLLLRALRAGGRRPALLAARRALSTAR